MQLNRAYQRCRGIGWGAAAVLAALLGAGPGPLRGIEGQQPGGPGEVVKEIAADTYQQILDNAFPVRLAVNRSIVFILTVRTVPSFDPESQITIKLLRDRSGSVESLVADRSIRAFADRRFATSGEQRPDVLARGVGVRRATIEISAAQAERWHHDFWEVLKSSLSTLEGHAKELSEKGRRSIVLDGDRYDFWYAQGGTVLQGSLGESDLAGQHSGRGIDIAAWTKSIAGAVAGKADK